MNTTTLTLKSPPKYSDKLIDKYRNVYVDHNDWADNATDCFKSRMEALGIHVDNVYWRGFWSQGDGAMFEGEVHDWGKYLSHLGYTDPILIDCAEQFWTYKWTHSGHYYHEYSVSYEDGVYRPDNPYTDTWDDAASDEDKFRGAVWDAAMDQQDLLALTEKIQEDLRDHMRDLYNQLEEEYDSLTSDEIVIEWLEANDIDPSETD